MSSPVILEENLLRGMDKLQTVAKLTNTKAQTEDSCAGDGLGLEFNALFDSTLCLLGSYRQLQHS